VSFSSASSLSIIVIKFFSSLPKSPEKHKVVMLIFLPVTLPAAVRSSEDTMSCVFMSLSIAAEAADMAGCEPNRPLAAKDIETMAAKGC